ncbi:MAG: hypothetical protein IPJ60_02025 [Sphingobacteriaceae bacterium]|nr:hypothetical protein [Sphingobacteriaceae bacterium]
MIQLPEVIIDDQRAIEAGFTTIADIGKERIRRVIKTLYENEAALSEEVKLIEEKIFAKEVEIHNLNNQVSSQLFNNTLATNEIQILKEQVEDYNFQMAEKLQLIDNINKMDKTFKVFKLAKSNFKIWDAQFEKMPNLVQEKLFGYIDHISPTAEQEAILYELLLKSGFELTTPIAELTLAGIRVFSIADGQLLVCLEKIITYDCLKEMSELQPTRVICLDESFIGENADALKTNAVQIMRSKGVKL